MADVAGRDPGPVRVHIVVGPGREDVGRVPSLRDGVNLHRIAAGQGKAGQYLRVLIGLADRCGFKDVLVLDEEDIREVMKLDLGWDDEKVGVVLAAVILDARGTTTADFWKDGSPIIQVSRRFQGPRTKILLRHTLVVADDVARAEILAP